VRPVDDQSLFGYCDNCGIVYALKDRLQEQRRNETPRDVELGFGEEPKKTDRPRRATFVDTEKPPKPFNSHWKCPDCGADVDSANDSYLEFAKREHIREYHPNRSTA
jgi:hypothetical protein